MRRVMRCRLGCGSKFCLRAALHASPSHHTVFTVLEKNVLFHSRMKYFREIVIFTACFAAGCCRMYRNGRLDWTLRWA